MSREIKFRHIKGDGCVEFVRLNTVMSSGIVEQYTGLKDKNGKEIYEGDVVHITPYFKKKGGKRFMAQKPYRNPLSVIEWDDDAGAFSENTYENGEFQIGGFLFEMALDSETLEGTQRHTIEVIGNIHENPELLEGEK